MRLWYRFCRMWCGLGFRLAFSGRVYGRENVPRRGGVLLVSNHQSFLDPVLATLALDRECDYMARDSLFANRWFRRLIESLNAFPIKRGTGDVGAVKETLRRLRAGRLIVAFPEATRTYDGGIGSMQPGAVLVARKAAVPIVPTLIHGAFEAWPRHARLPRPRPIIVAYDRPIPPDVLAGEEPEGAIEMVRTRIVAMKTRLERGLRSGS
jgi:1-acyl-sn-glycerol-3-phosphate acyltransferase